VIEAAKRAERDGRRAELRYARRRQRLHRMPWWASNVGYAVFVALPAAVGAVVVVLCAWGLPS